MIAASARRIAALVAAAGVMAAGGVAVAAGGVAVAAPVATGAPTTSATVTVSPTAITAPRSDSFVGLALTYRELPKWFGAAAPADRLLPRLIRNLAPTGRPSLRIGGESADRSWWPIKGRPRPFGVEFDLGPAWVADALRLAHATNPQLMLGLELEADQPTIDGVEARQLLHGLGRRYVGSFQIGNEPDLYTVLPWYKLRHGRKVPWYSKTGTTVFARQAPYTPADYVSEVQQILRVIPHYPIAGPETNVGRWMTTFGSLLAPAGPATTLTSHGYGVDACPSDHDPDTTATVANLLSMNASRHDVLPSTAGLSVARAHHAQFRIDELGAVTCGGPAAVSGSMATALWGVDALFYAASEGVDGVNLHDPYARSNSLFSVRRSGRRWLATVRPLYYGALLFGQADPAGWRLLKVDGDTDDALRVWASEGPAGNVRVTAINDNATGAARVTVKLPASARLASGTVERLQASGTRGPYATRGITLGGRSFGQTASGVLGRQRTTAVAAKDGSLTVSLAAGSVALVRLGPG